MPKQPDGHLVADTPVRQTGSTKDEAPTAGTVRASEKFLDRVIKGEFAMETSVKTLSRQETRLKNAGLDLAGLAMCRTETLIGILQAIARLSEDKTITTLAEHGGSIAGDLHDEADVCREDIEQILAGGV